MDDVDKVDVIWCQDSYGNTSAHKNGESLSFQESMIGSLLWNNKSGEWHPVMKDGTDLGGFSSLHKARFALETNWRNSKNPVKEVSAKTATRITKRT
jgi:hypothetical protein